MKSKSLFLLSVLSLMALASCGGTSTSVSSQGATSSATSQTTSTTPSEIVSSTISQAVVTSSLTLSGPTSVEVNATITLVAEYDEGAAVDLTFTSSSPLVASVSNEGVVKGLGIGTATITVKDSKSNLTDSVEISVIEAFPTINTTGDLVNYIRNTSIQKESMVGKSTIHKEEKDTSGYEDVTDMTVTHYTDYIIRRDTVENIKYSYGSTDSTNETDVHMIKDNTYYELSLDNNEIESSYCAKYKIVDFPESTTSQITLEEARSRTENYYVFSDIANEIAGLPSTSETLTVTKGELITITVEGYYVKVWANNVNADYSDYQMTIKFMPNGIIDSFDLTQKVYSDTSYDIASETLKEDAVVEEESTYSMKTESLELTSSSENTIDPTAYFVSQYVAAHYGEDNTISVGESLYAIDITIDEYLPATALDYDEFVIADVINSEGEMQFDYNSLWSSYEAIAPGKATIVIAARSDASVTYNIEVAVVE